MKMIIIIIIDESITCKLTDKWNPISRNVVSYLSRSRIRYTHYAIHDHVLEKEVNKNIVAWS